MFFSLVIPEKIPKNLEVRNIFYQILASHEIMLCRNIFPENKKKKKKRKQRKQKQKQNSCFMSMLHA